MYLYHPVCMLYHQIVIPMVAFFLKGETPLHRTCKGKERQHALLADMLMKQGAPKDEPDKMVRIGNNLSSSGIILITYYRA